MPKYYIASSLDNAKQVRELKAVLDKAGWEHTYDWTVHGSVQKQGFARIAEVAEKETLGVSLADVIIVLLPGGRGTHTELGIALAKSMTRKAFGHRVVIYSNDKERDFGTNGTTCAFYHHPAVEKVTSWPELLRTLAH
jgi:nucleoside 2-deoxyribosyltransferase